MELTSLRDLRYLVAVADKRHFGHAAEACHVSQPTLSAQIKKLEAYLGMTLFERTNKSVAITPVGEQVVRHARLALEQADVIVAIAEASTAPLTGPLRLGVIPTLAPYLLPWIVKPVAKRFPELILIPSEDLTDNLLQSLSNHEIDAALLALPVDDGELDSIPLFREPFWIAFPPDHPISRKAVIRDRDLQELDLLLLAEGHCLRDQALSVCQGLQKQNDLGDLRATSLETIRQMVAAGYGCTLLPALAVHGPRRRTTQVEAKPLNLPNAERVIGLVFRQSYPRRADLAVLGDAIVAQLPDIVTAADRS